MNRTELINKYALDVTVNKLERLDEIVKLTNINNDYNEENYISLDIVDDNTWKINFWGKDENIIFKRCENDKKYFKMI